VPNPGESFFWYGAGKFKQTFLDHHSGLTAQEMEIPLIAMTP
jgi:hypothetical protein